MAAGIIKRHVANQLVWGIECGSVDEWYKIEKLDEPLKSWPQYLEPAQEPCCDQVVCGSEPEHNSVRDLEDGESVLAYIRLPDWFRVTTPVGEHNAERVLAMRNSEGGGAPLPCLARETKATKDLDKLHPNERRKIPYG